jgi:energy-coupling factor transporter ATP-binding protein EcfA2
MRLDPEMTPDHQFDRSNVVCVEPSDWWGPVWAAPCHRSVLELVSTGVTDAQTAALLWTLVEQGHSLTVAAGPSGAGKTTLLTSLLDAIPPGRNRRFVGGIFERFQDLDELRAGETALLVNEISPHLPIYCWGPALRRLLEAASSGYQVLGTIHARTPHEIVSSLAAYPLRLPPQLIAALGTIVFMEAWEEGGAVVRQARSVVRMGFDESRQAVCLRELKPGDGSDLTQFTKGVEIDLTLIARRADLIGDMAAQAADVGRSALIEALRIAP